MIAISRYLNDFLSLFYPELCAACGVNLVANEQVICSNCIYHLPYTNFHRDAENKLARQFWGRIPFVHCSAYLYFQKGLKVQSLMHQLKYNNRPEVGVKLGEMFGSSLQESFQHLPDLIVPVPLHPSREKKRGYNQSFCFATGLSNCLNIPVDHTHLLRRSATESQTRKSRFSRYENMKEVFFVKDKQHFEGKHILLIDDIITTGSTIESCANTLLAVDNVKISIAAIAFTS